MLALLVVLLSSPCTVRAQMTDAATAPTSRPTSRPARTSQDAITPRVKNPERHAQFLHRIQQGPIDLLFMGDSITDFWPRTGEYSWLKFAPYHPANFGISGDCTEHVLWRIANGELDDISPKVVVLMIGTNNVGGSLGGDEPEWAAAGVAKIVQRIHEKLPATKVLLLGVFPRAAKDSPKRAAVDAVNQIIKNLDNGSTTRYLDIGHVFLDADGDIPRDIMPDRLHPSARGYDLWYDAMRPLLEEMMGPPSPAPPPATTTAP